jgi:hypothetical protein
LRRPFGGGLVRHGRAYLVNSQYWNSHIIGRM